MITQSLYYMRVVAILKGISAVLMLLLFTIYIKFVFGKTFKDLIVVQNTNYFREYFREYAIQN